MRRIATGPVSFNVDDDKETFWDKVEAGQWEPETLAALAGRVGPGTTVLDIGAWVGPITLLCAGLGAEVLAFEPDPRAFAMLTRNVASNPQLSSRISLRERALAPRTGSLRIGSPRKPGDSMGSVLMADRVAATWEAETMTPALLAAELSDAGRIVLKLDVEGAEYELLQHMAPLLGRPLAACIIAFHPRILAATGVDGAGIDEMSEAAERVLSGYYARRLDGAADTGAIPRDANATMLFEPLPGRPGNLEPAMPLVRGSRRRDWRLEQEVRAMQSSRREDDPAPGRPSRAPPWLPITIEAEEPGNRLSTLRVLAAGEVKGEGLTAAQAHVLVGDLLERAFPPAPDPRQ
jgi:FkbM family methyltransferase